MTTKTCFKCHHTLPIEDFYKHPQMADGHLGKCKECTRIDSIMNRRKRVEAYREYDRKRGRSPRRIERSKTFRRLQKMLAPHKIKARTAASNARRRDKLDVEPCYFCGSTSDIEMHHPNYHRPMAVYWLCRICHSKLHGMARVSAFGVDTKNAS